MIQCCRSAWSHVFISCWYFSIWWLEIWRIHFIALIRPKRINLIPFEQSINIKFFVPQLEKCQRLRWGHLRCNFCLTIKKSEILSVKGLREEFWKWRRRFLYDLNDIYVLTFLLNLFPKKKIENLKTWCLGVTTRAEVVHKNSSFQKKMMWCLYLFLKLNNFMIGDWKSMRRGIDSPQANQFPCLSKKYFEPYSTRTLR